MVPDDPPSDETVSDETVPDETVPDETLPDVARAYVALCLRLRRLVPDLVDAVAVDPALRRTVAAEPAPTAAAVVRDAGRLAAELAASGSARGRFLTAQLRAVEWRARRLAGQAVPFGREVHECLDVAAVPGEPDAYRAAHRELAALLPGAGPLAARMAAHRRRDTIPPDRFADGARALSAALRSRVVAPYGLPTGESVEHRVVEGAPWSALHTYRGALCSTVRYDVGAAAAGRLPRLVAHETYPGHHVECCRGELAAARGRVELAVTVLGTPQTVVSEGMAVCALDAAVGPGWGRWGEGVLAAVGVPLDGELAERLDAARAALRRARVDAALLLHGDGRPTAGAADAAEAHLRRWLLLADVRARRMVDALARPMWRTQAVAAVEGAELVRNCLLRPGVHPVARHRGLLDDPPTPSALRLRTCMESRTICDGR